MASGLAEQRSHTRLMTTERTDSPSASSESASADPVDPATTQPEPANQTEPDPRGEVITVDHDAADHDAAEPEAVEPEAVEPEAPEPAAEPPAPLLEMLDLETASDEAQPDVHLERDGLVVTGTDAQHVAVDLEALCELCLTVLSAEGADKGRLDLHLVTAEVIADLNVEHLGGDGPTDVLSFPLDADDFDVPSASADLPPMLGDVVLCPAVAIEQAANHAGSDEAELALLVIHGVLHILGHDHAEPEETIVMQNRERAHLEPLGFDHPVSES